MESYIKNLGDKGIGRLHIRPRQLGPEGLYLEGEQSVDDMRYADIPA